MRFTITNDVPQAVQPAEVWVLNPEASGSFSVAQAFTPGNRRAVRSNSPINGALKVPAVSHPGVKGLCQNSRDADRVVMPQRGYDLQPRVDASATLGTVTKAIFNCKAVAPFRVDVINKTRRNRVAVEGFATGNGKDSSTSADFDWFEYKRMAKSTSLLQIMSGSSPGP